MNSTNNKGLIYVFITIFIVTYTTITSSEEALEVYNIPIRGENIVFMLDISGSMEGKDERSSIEGFIKKETISKAEKYLPSWVPSVIREKARETVENKMTKLAHAKRRLLPAIDALPTTTKFNIILIYGDVKIWKPELVPASMQNKIDSKALVKKLSAKGGTNLSKAFSTVFSMKKVDEIFIISDGRPTDGNPAKILSKLSELNKKKKIIINTIGLGKDQDKELLMKIAEDNDGQYVDKLFTLF